MISVHLVERPGGPQILDLTPLLLAAPLVHGARGDGDLALTLRIADLSRQLLLLERAGAPWVEVYDTGALVYRGRIEDAQASSAGALELVAYGAWRVLEDARDTALWSDTSVERWFVLDERMLVEAYPNRFNISFDNRVFIGARKGAIIGTSPFILGAAGFVTPSQSSRVITNLTFDYSLTAAAGGATWGAELQQRTAPEPVTGAWTYLGTTAWSITAAAGATTSGTACVALSPTANGVFFYLYRSAANAAITDEDDANRITVTNLRVTTTPLLVDTVITVVALTGATSITVASAANITPGLILFLQTANGAIPAGERAQVLSVAGNVVTLTGPINFSYSVGFNQVRAQRVLASDVAAHLAGVVSALNPSQLQAEATLIQETDTDRRDLLYEDASPAKVIEQLATDEQLSCGVSRERLVWLREAGQAAYQQTFAVDLSDITVGRTIEGLRNQVYPVYQSASGEALRGSAATSATSVARWGITRQAALATDTTDAAEAESLRDRALDDSDDPAPQLAITIRRLTTAGGSVVPLTAIEAGDTLIIRNLVLSSAAAIDQLATVRVARATVDVATQELDVELENPPATLEIALARAALRQEDLPIRVFNAAGDLVFL